MQLKIEKNNDMQKKNASRSMTAQQNMLNKVHLKKVIERTPLTEHGAIPVSAIIIHDAFSGEQLHLLFMVA